MESVKKRILFTVSNDLNFDQRMIRICSSLSNAGYDICLVGRRLPKSKKLQTQSFQQKRIYCWFKSGKSFYLEYNFRLFFFLLFAKADAICSIDLDTLLAGFYAAKIRRRFCIYDAHEFFTEVPELVERPKTKAIWESLANHIIPKLRYCYTVCESLANIFQKKYGPSFKVIRNLPFAKKQNPIAKPEILEEFSIPPNKKILLYQGALNDGRGLEEIISIMPQIENAVLLLAGEGDCSQSLRQKVIELSLSDKIIFLGYVLPQKLRELTPHAYIGLNLLQNKGLNYYYSLANKFFDYIQDEKPSINMNFPEYALHNQEFEVSQLIDDLSSEKLLSAVQKLLNDDTYYQQLQANCKQAKQNYIWEKESQKLIHFYQEIFKKK